MKTQPSLNDVLHSGPCLLPFLQEILLRFRIGKIGLVSDIHAVPSTDDLQQTTRKV